MRWTNFADRASCCTLVTHGQILQAISNSAYRMQSGIVGTLSYAVQRSLVWLAAPGSVLRWIIEMEQQRRAGGGTGDHAARVLRQGGVCQSVGADRVAAQSAVGRLGACPGCAAHQLWRQRVAGVTFACSSVAPLMLLLLRRRRPAHVMAGTWSEPPHR